MYSFVNGDEIRNRITVLDRIVLALAQPRYISKSRHSRQQTVITVKYEILGLPSKDYQFHGKIVNFMRRQYGKYFGTTVQQICHVIYASHLLNGQCLFAFKSFYENAQ